MNIETLLLPQRLVENSLLEYKIILKILRNDVDSLIWLKRLDGGVHGTVRIALKDDAQWP